jgi:hypothetical protein
MKTEQLFYESITDAIHTVVQVLGGAKKVGPMLWPALNSTAAARRLIDCLNESRPEKFSPDELMKLARWGRDAGCHSIANYFAQDSGYAQPVPVSPADEKADLERKAIDAVSQFRVLVERYEAATRK